MLSGVGKVNLVNVTGPSGTGARPPPVSTVGDHNRTHLTDHLR